MLARLRPLLSAIHQGIAEQKSFEKLRCRVHWVSCVKHFLIFISNDEGQTRQAISSKVERIINLLQWLFSTCGPLCMLSFFSKIPKLFTLKRQLSWKRKTWVNGVLISGLDSGSEFTLRNAIATLKGYRNAADQCYANSRRLHQRRIQLVTLEGTHFVRFGSQVS